MLPGLYHPGTPHDFVRDADGKPVTDKPSPTFADAPAGTPAHPFHRSRNRIAYKLIEALEKDFHEHGDEAIKIARIERPVEYLRIIASVIPKEFEITDSRLGELSDEELDAFIARLRAQLRSPAITDAGEREEPTTH
jgi:hypothetical protein